MDLRGHQWMAEGMTQWQTLRHGGQQDYSDFLAFMLGWMGANSVSQNFERRFEEKQKIAVAEKGGKHAPVTLHTDLWKNLTEPTPLGLVIQSWHEQHGMKTALMVASSIICLQVCRFENMDQPDCRTFDFGSYTFAFPVFIDKQMTIARVQYTMIAAVHYAGNSWRGHYQSAVRVGNAWLLQNDNAPPTIQTELPAWFASGISHIWMVRSDQHRQLQLVNDNHQVADAMAEVQALLRNDANMN